MNTTKSLLGCAVLLFASLTALGQPEPSRRFENSLLNEVVQMTRAQLPDAAIVAYLRARATRLEADVTAGDLIRLHRAGVSARVIEFIASASGVEDRSDVSDRRPAASLNSDESRAESVDPDDGDLEVYRRPYGSVYDGWPWWDGYPYWYAYSPFYYGGVFIHRGGRHGRDGDHGGDGRHHGGGDHPSRDSGSRSSHGGSSHGGSHGGGSHGGGGHGRH
jgi:hypothetical protein